MKIIGLLRNESLVSYTKPLIELKGRPTKRYKTIRDLIPSSGSDSNQILATLGNELVRFQNETVSIFQYSLRDVVGSTETNDLGGNFYLFLRVLWLSTHHTYFENAKREQLGISY